MGLETEVGIKKTTETKMNKLAFMLCTICFLAGTTKVTHAQTTCEVIGEISISVVERGAFIACTRSANPAACSIALAADACGSDPACSGLVKKFTKAGCTWTVKVVGKKIKIYGKAAASKLDEMKSTYDALNTVDGIRWIENSMVGW